MKRKLFRRARIVKKLIRFHHYLTPDMLHTGDFPFILLTLDALVLSVAIPTC
jgi:hypothetical protein